jgi:DNA invertase Pin-like site-specific DNA recombinase
VSWYRGPVDAENKVDPTRAQGKHLGRPKVDPELERKAQRELRKGTGILKVAKQLGLGTGTVQRIANEMRA